MQLFGGGDEFAKKKDIINPNLFTGSKDFTGSKWINISENPQKDKYLDFTAIYVNWTWMGISQYIAVNKGETFTASMYVKVSAGSSVSWYINLPSDEGAYKQVNVDSNSKTINGTGNWQKTSITFTVTGDSGAIRPRIESDGSSPYWIAGMKLERGAAATPWCPAYEDYVAKSDFDNKVNVDQEMFKSIDQANSWSDILSNPQNESALISIRDNTNGGRPSDNGNVAGGNSAGIVFGGNDTHAIISVGWVRPSVRVAAGAGNDFKWHDDVVLKSEYDKLVQRVATLEKQIGGK